MSSHTQNKLNPYYLLKWMDGNGVQIKWIINTNKVFITTLLHYDTLEMALGRYSDWLYLCLRLRAVTHWKELDIQWQKLQRAPQPTSKWTKGNGCLSSRSFWNMLLNATRYGKCLDKTKYILQHQMLHFLRLDSSLGSQFESMQELPIIFTW